jgi:subtilisin
MNWNEEILGIPNAWRLTRGKGIKVAVLDTGFTKEHNDFVGAFRAENIQDFANENGTGDDIVGHGTHCAGLIGARNFSEGGIVGVAPECELLFGKVQKNGRGFRSGPISKGIAWARLKQADIICMSFSTSDISDQGLQEQIQGALQDGIVLVAAAGNNADLLGETLLYPAIANNVIAVGAVDDATLQQRGGRSFHRKLDFILPFQKYLSTWNGIPGFYKDEEGCSMATALVAGVVSLLFASSGNRLPLDKVKNELRESAQRIDINFTFGNRTVIACM